MTRVAWFVTVVALVLVASASSALAAPSVIEGHPDTPEGWTFKQGERAFVWSNTPDVAEAPEQISHILWLNRCDAGCTYTKSTDNDALNNQTQIGGVPVGTQMHITPWAQSEQIWTDYVACMREVYGPYDVQVVTVDPGNVPHHEAVVAGRASDMMVTGALGIAPLDASTCIPKNNVISFTFANDHGPDPIGMCWTTAQESAHSYGLDHAFDCSDPMTYLDGCGQKFFRNKDFRCGEFAARDCRCGSPTQNSHNKLLANFGPGTDPAAPVVMVVSPMAGTVPATFSVFANATDHRGVSYAQLFINGWMWSRKDGAGPTYVLDLPGDVPDGVMDLKVKACNDLDICGEAPTITVTRGAPCTDAATNCRTGQKCEAGKCFWDPPTIDFGGECTYDQACVSGRCADGGRGAICTETCFGPPNDRCPDGFECSADPGGEGVCRAAGDDSTGCCSAQVGTGGGTLFVNLGLGAMIGLLVVRRRRKKAS